MNRPDDISSFYFTINNGKEDFYNSQNENLERDFFNYKIPLTKADKQRIYKKYKEIGFEEFPNTFKFAEGNALIGFPNFDTELKICENRICHKVILNLFDFDNNQLQQQDKAFKYLELYNLIWKLVRLKEEYKSIPKSDTEYL